MTRTLGRPGSRVVFYDRRRWWDFAWFAGLHRDWRPRGDFHWNPRESRRFHGPGAYRAPVGLGQVWRAHDLSTRVRSPDRVSVCGVGEWFSGRGGSGHDHRWPFMALAASQGSGSVLALIGPAVEGGRGWGGSLCRPLRRDRAVHLLAGEMCTAARPKCEP